VREVAEGLRYLWRDRLLRTLALTVGLTNFVDAPIAVALVVYVREELGRPEALGFIWGVFGASALGGSLLYGAFGHRLSRRTVFVAGFAGTVVPFALLALTPPLPAVLLAAVAIGIAAGPINPILMTVRQERVPPALRGRVFGAMRAMAWSAMPLGVLAGGFAIEAFGVGATFAIMAASYLAATVSLAVNPAVRRMDDRRIVTVPTSSPAHR
jgi:MFS family permease